MTRTLLLAALLVAGAVSAEPPRASRVEVTSDPEGAMVSVDGVERGLSPQTLWDLKPGPHLFVLSKEGYEPADFTEEVAEGACLQREVTLVPQKGLLLVTTEPAGCDLLVNDLSVGETPRLVTDLEVTKAHCLTLRKTGYLTQNLSVKFAGRTPAVRQVKMVLDSGNLVCSSRPEGAKVLVDGHEGGVTPFTVERLAKGVHTVEFTMEGYASERKTVEIAPGDERRVSAELKPLPGALEVTSRPRGVSVVLDGVSKGNAPLTLSNVPAGEHTIRGSASGCLPFEKTVYVKPGETAQVSLELESDSGTLEVKSNPAGAQLLLDGKPWGVTKAIGGQDASDVLRVDVPSGEHEITLRLSGYGDATKKVKIVRGESVSVSAKLRRKFVPDVEVRTVSGSCPGVLLSNTSEGVTIETSPGVSRSFRHSEIRELKFLTDVLQ